MIINEEGRRLSAAEQMNSEGTTIADVREEQAKISEYIYKKEVKKPVQYNVILGERSIGKTHFIMREMYRSVKGNSGTAFLLVCRTMNQLSHIKLVVQKYSHLAGVGKEWIYDRNTIYEIDTETGDSIIIGYATYLNGVDRSKIGNYDNPYVKHVFFDEVFSFMPLADEFRKLQVLRGTVSRRTGVLVEPIVIWMAGNEGMGVSPIINSIGIDVEELRGRGKDFVYWRSSLESSDGSLNIVVANVRSIEVGNMKPDIEWTYLKRGYGLYIMENHLYIKELNKKTKPLSRQIINQIMVLLYQQPDINNSIFYETPRCMHLKAVLQSPLTF